MAKILFDEKFWNDFTSIEYFKQVILFVNKYFDIDTVIFRPNCTLGNGSYRNMFFNLDLQMLKIKNLKLVDSSSLSNIHENNCIFNELEFSKIFLKQIEYLEQQQECVIIVASEYYHNKDIKKINDCIFIINNVYTELDSNISYFILEDKYIKNIIIPSKDNPLPNVDLCKKYKSLQDELVKGKSKKERQAIYYRIGKEVLSRNLHKDDKKITLLNPSVYGGVTSIMSKKNIFSSVDIEHGAIEIFSDRGKHIDEYDYIGTPQNKCDKKGEHNINV